MKAATDVMENCSQTPFGAGFLSVANHWVLTRRWEEGGIGRMTPETDTGPHDLTDNDLLERVGAARDREAFAVLFKALAPRVKAYIMKLGATPDIAEEVVQETFVTVWRKATQFDRSKSSAVTWTFTIARNLRIDRIRKENRPALDPNEPLLMPSETPTPLQQMEQATIVKRVTASIDELPLDQQEVIKLSFIEGLSHQDISDRLGVPLGTVKSRLRLSFDKLRLSLGEIQ
jgi:RNA polymerase sigma-70 factor (ECF subfamily)